MANLTLQEAIVKPAANPEARPGHSLVVYEESGRGRRFVRVVPPGEFFRPPFLSFGKSFIGYWVMADPHLKYCFKRDCKTRDHLCDYGLRTSISYEIVGPELLVEKLDADPLERLCERADELISTRLAHLDWNVIKEGGEAFSAALASAYVSGAKIPLSCREELRGFALEYGIEVHQLAIERALPEGELKAELKTKEIQAQRGILRSQAALDFEAQHHDQAIKVRGVIDTVVTSVDKMLERAGEKVSSYPEMKNALKELAQVRDMASHLVGPSAGADGDLPGQGHGPNGTFADSRSFSGEDALSRMLIDLCGHFGAVDRRFRFKILSDSLHLIGEILLDSSADADTLERYRRRLCSACDPDQGYELIRSQSQFLLRIAGVKDLASELRGES